MLGGASLINLSLSEVDRLLQTAAEHGVRRVDTAPLYGDSQKLLGRVLKDYPCFLVSSKVGRPNFSDFNPQGIRKSVELTLKDLGISQLDTLFVHSLPKSYLESQNLVVLEEIRRSGVVNRIGFSGDNEDLRAASSLEFFSCLMFSLNPLDLSNLKFLNENSKNPPQLYLKRVLANGVYNIHLERELRNFLRVISKKPTFTAHAEYKRRYRVLYGSRLNPTHKFRFFMQFALMAAGLNSLLTVGVSTPQQLLRCLREEKRFNERFRVKNFQTEFNRANIFSELWEAIN